VKADEGAQVASSNGAPTTLVKTLMSSEIERSYRILAPVVDEDPKLPMLIVMHGWGVDALSTEVGIGLDEFALANRVILVVPEGIGLPGTQDLAATQLGS
jgi:polyhydroxybutyrate depolymerase